VNWLSYEMCRKLKRKYTASPAPKTTGLENLFHFRQEDNTQKALTEESKNIWCSIGNIYKNILVRCAQKQYVNASSAQNATKQMYLCIHIRQLWLTKSAIHILNFSARQCSGPEGILKEVWYLPCKLVEDNMIIADGNIPNVLFQTVFKARIVVMHIIP